MAHIKRTDTMHYSRTIVLIILSFVASNFYGQDIEKKYRKLKHVSQYHLVINNDSIEPFYISENPITNREYLTYLCWLSDVYRNYPVELLKAFPNLDNKQIDSLFYKWFTPIQIRTLVEGTYFTEHYMFSPKYLDYPVLGLNWDQSMNYLNWLSDRYNESLLIKKRILELYHNQFSENNFNTEAYLMDQYEGLVNSLIWDPETKQPRSVKWKDRILVPAFRLPSQNEINIVQQSIHSSLEEYKPNEFLKYWTNYYMEINKYETILRIEGDNYLSFSYNKNVTMRPEYHEMLGEISEITLNQQFVRNENSTLKIFSDLGQDIVTIKNTDDSILKDSLGHMPFIIIGEDENLNPIFIKRVDYPRENTEQGKREKKYSIFRYALCGIKK
jgi:hypothetical protein